MCSAVAKFELRKGRCFSCLKNFIDSLNIKRRGADSFIESTSPYRAVKPFVIGYKNQSDYAVSSASADSFI
jgi:hypothetical protein